MSAHNIIRADILKHLSGEQWAAQSGYAPKYHAVIGDPPYFLGSIVERFGKPDSAAAKFGADGSFSRLSRGFMGQQWDGFSDVWAYQAWVTEWARLLLDFVHPGAVLALFGGNRTYHRLAAGLEDAGWIVSDGLLAWMYGSGFPKAYNLSRDMDDPKWDGYTQALKPSYEPIVLARAPRGKATFADLAREYGTGALNIDGSRILTSEKFERKNGGAKGNGGVYGDSEHYDFESNLLGRYPANTILVCDCGGDQHAADCPVAVLDAQSGDRKAGGNLNGNEPSDPMGQTYGGYQRMGWQSYGDPGGASRFFYCAKASTDEREWGLREFTPRNVNDGRDTPIDNPYQRGDTLRKNTHPTVKPIELITYLARLLLPPVLDAPRRILVPFSGSGSEMIGCHLAGWDEIDGIERESEYADIAAARLAWWTRFSSYDEAKANAMLENYKTRTGQLDMFEVVP